MSVDLYQEVVVFFTACASALEGLQLELGFEPFSH